MAAKHATSIGSAPPDPVKSQAAAMPMPIPVLENKTAPGQTGPRGLSPRTTYSRVNAAPPPTTSLPDGMKASPARGAEFLPAKTAHAEEPNMKMAQRPTLQDMMKAAMEGTIERVDINQEAARQLAGHRGESSEKVASVAQSEHYSTEHIMKMASALDFIAETFKVADDGSIQMPGKGPGSLDVQEAKSEGSLLEAGQSGQAISADRPPEDPPQQKEEVQVGNAGTGMQTNDDMSHGEQPTAPIKNQNTSIGPMNPLPNPTESTKSAAALFEANLSRLGLKVAAAKPAAPAPKAKAPTPAPKGGGKAPIAKLRKMAEDAVNPASIEAGSENPPDATAAGQGVPRQPSDVRSQVNSMLASNQAAIDYTKGEAKADPKSDVNQVLEQPALTRAGDSVLHRVFDNTGEAGVKISSKQKPGTQLAGDTVKVAAARALLSNLMDKVAAEQSGKKKKESMMGSAPKTPSSASGFTASSLG